MRAHYEIRQEDVGKRSLSLFGRGWSVADFMGRILPGDVGKRIFLVGDILQVENDEQRDKRRAWRGVFNLPDADSVQPLSVAEVAKELRLLSDALQTVGNDTLAKRLERLAKNLDAAEGGE